MFLVPVLLLVPSVGCLFAVGPAFLLNRATVVGSAHV